MAVYERLTEEEMYLVAILQDESGLDLAEFTWHDASRPDGCWRAWPFQVPWFRCLDEAQIDSCGRSVGKSQSIAVRAFVFPFIHPDQEMVITAPEKVHLDAITDKIETALVGTRLTREMLIGGRAGIKHQPFHVNFTNKARIMGRIPQRDGKGVKGCLNAGEIVWTDKGATFVEDLRVGDEVITHEGRLQPVTAIYEDVNDSYEVRGQSSFPLRVSCDHRFMGAQNLASPKQKRNLGETFFQDVEFLEEDNWYWASPTSFPELPVSATDCSVDGVPWEECKSFWWLVGRWLADGYLSRDKKNGNGRRVHWVAVSDKAKVIASMLENLGLTVRTIKRDHSSADVVEVASAALNRWLDGNFGQLSDGKSLPTWSLGMVEGARRSLLDGYLSGDGHVSKTKNRIECGTASKKLAVGLQLLGQSLGYTVNCSEVTPKTTHISGVALKNPPKTSYRLQLLTTGHPILRDGFLYSKVKSVTPIGKQTVYDIKVAEDRTYLSGSIVSHNIHPIWLEMDEAQDYPKLGWTEIANTLNRGFAGACWRAHGVTRGMRDEFHKHTQAGSGWTIHNYVGMNRPTWTDKERQDLIQKYGSKNSPDYRRNVMGFHGDATNPLFVLHRLMRCVDKEIASDYNQYEYYSERINDEMLHDHELLSLLHLPASHKSDKYLYHWIGMDVGFTSDPTEILVWGEEKPTKKSKDEPASYLRLLTRLHLERVKSPEQAKLIAHLIRFYKPKRFAMDSTGLGLPLFDQVQADAPDCAKSISGYNFSEKILVGWDGTVDVDEWTGDPTKESEIKRNVKEYSQDCLRDLVDQGRLILPFDKELIAQFEGGTEQTMPSRDQYGRRRLFSVDDDHALDAARMFALGWKQFYVDEVTAKDRHEPIFDAFMTF